MTSPTFPPNACWIGSAHPFDLHEVYLDFRSPVLDLAMRPGHAELLITADSRYRLWINGRFVAAGRRARYPWRQSVDRIDVTPFLRPGANTMAVQVYQPGYSHFAYVHRAAAGLLAVLRTDGETRLVTDPTWRVRRNRSFAENVPRISIYGSGVEDRDMAQDDAWTEPAYDHSMWDAARIVAPVNGYPWTGMAVRGVPLLEERELTPALIDVRSAAAVDVRGRDIHAALRRAWQGSRPEAPLPVADGWFQSTATGEKWPCWLFDLGRAMPARAGSKSSGATGPARDLLVSYAEKTRDGELVLSDPATYCRVRLTDRFALRAGDQVAESFSHARRALSALHARRAGGPYLRLRFHSQRCGISAPVDRLPSRRSGAPGHRSPLRASTFAACLQDGFVDSAWRESSQWVGDALPQALIMSALSDDTRPLRRVIELAAQGAYPDGVLPSVVPGEVHAYTIVDYNFIWVELLELYWRLTGDDIPCRRAVAGAGQTARSLRSRRAGADGLIRSQPGRRLFLDWAPVSRQEPNAIYNLHYLLALQTAAKLAGEVERGDAAGRWQDQAIRLRLACRAAFLQDGRWWDDRERTTASQLVAALAVLTGAAEADEQIGAARRDCRPVPRS